MPRGAEGTICSFAHKDWRAFCKCAPLALVVVLVLCLFSLPRTSSPPRLIRPALAFLFPARRSQVFDMLYGGVFQRFMLGDHGRAWAQRFAQPLDEVGL